MVCFAHLFCLVLSVGVYLLFRIINCSLLNRNCGCFLLNFDSCICSGGNIKSSLYPLMVCSAPLYVICTKKIVECSLSSDKEVDLPKPSPGAKKSQLLWLSLGSDSHGKEEMNMFQTCTEHKFSNNHALIWHRDKKARK